MTATTILVVLAYSALLGLIAKRELPTSMRLPLWTMCVSAAGGMVLTALAFTHLLDRVWVTGWIRYPVIVLDGAIALMSAVIVVHSVRSSRHADSVTA